MAKNKKEEKKPVEAPKQESPKQPKGQRTIVTERG